MYDCYDYASGFSCAQYGYGTYSSALTDSFYGNRYGYNRQRAYNGYKATNVANMVKTKHADLINQWQYALQNGNLVDARKVQNQLQYECQALIDQYGYDVTTADVLSTINSAFLKSTKSTVSDTIFDNVQSLEDRAYKQNFMFGWFQDIDETSAEEMYADYNGATLSENQLRDERRAAQKGGAATGAILGVGGTAAVLGGLALANIWHPGGWALLIAAGVAGLGALAGADVANSSKTAEQEREAQEQVAQTNNSNPFEAQPRTVVI